MKPTTTDLEIALTDVENALRIAMKPNRQQFDQFVASIIHNNQYIHALPTEPYSMHRMISLSAFPEDVAHFDKRAAELLKNARDAHDALTEHLRSRRNEALSIESIVEKAAK